eukprot:760679-Hanusia_phi.AAC.8
MQEGAKEEDAALAAAAEGEEEEEVQEEDANMDWMKVRDGDSALTVVDAQRSQEFLFSRPPISA